MPLYSDPIDLKIDPTTDDLVIPPVFVSGVDAVRQGIERRVKKFRGEWFLNTDSGMPWFEDILGQQYDELKIKAAFREAILATPGVGSILSMSVSFSAATRLLSVTWKVQTQFDDSDEDVAQNSVVGGALSLSV